MEILYFIIVITVLLSSLFGFRFLAIDETDRMLEKGHFQELVNILEKINAIDSKKPKRQTFVFSATLTLTHELPKHVLMKKKIKFNRKISKMTPAQKLKKIIDTLNITNPKVVDITDKKGITTLSVIVSGINFNGICF